MEEALLRRAAGVRERLRAAAGLLQHAQHGRLHPRQVRAGRLRVPAGGLLLPPPVSHQRLALLARPGRAGQAGQHRADPGDCSPGALRGGPPLWLLGFPHEPLRDFYNSSLLRQREASPRLPRHALGDFQLPPHAQQGDPAGSHGDLQLTRQGEAVFRTRGGSSMACVRCGRFSLCPEIMQ